jgi:hypothetical protein
MRGFLRRHAGARVADPLRRLGLLIAVAVRERRPGAKPLHQRAQEFGAHRQSQVGLSLRDALAQVVDHLLRRVAAHVRIDRVAGFGAEAPGQTSGRVLEPRKRQPLQPARRVDGEAHHT